MSNVGYRIASIITESVLNHGIPYDEASKLIYGACEWIAKECTTGDWIEFPDGTTATITFKPKGQ